eukprot:jgi/Botrbrau1/9440/Bobra.0252s0063.1
MDKHGQGQTEGSNGIGCSLECRRASASSHFSEQAMEASLFQRTGEEEEDQEGGEGSECPNQPPRWYRPWRMLALFSTILFVVWFDQGVFASNSVTGCDPCSQGPPQPGIKTEFNLSQFQLGLLPSLFMVGLMVTSLLLCELRNHFNPFRLIGWGLLIWSLAAMGTGLSRNFASLIVARMFVGAGEASIVMLAAPFVDDAAPTDRKALWFAILTCFPSLGVAAGYLFGDVAQNIGWRALFYIESALAVPIILFTIFAPAVNLHHARSHGPELKRGVVDVWMTLRALSHDFGILHRHPVFLTNVWGYCAVQGVLGAFAFWGPKVFRELFLMGPEAADLVPGVLIVVTAVVGTLAGGYVLDRAGPSLRNAMVLQAVSAGGGMLALLLALLIPAGLLLFMLLLSIGLLGMFLVTSPLYAVCMWSIPQEQRPTGQAMLIITMHLFGDIPSPPAAGALQGVLQNWRYSMSIICSMLVTSCLLYSVGSVISAKSPDYRNDGGENHVAESSGPAA